MAVEVGPKMRRVSVLRARKRSVVIAATVANEPKPADAPIKQAGATETPAASEGVAQAQP